MEANITTRTAGQTRERPAGPRGGQSLEMTLSHRPGGIVARLRGSVGMEVAPCLRKCLERLVGAAGANSTRHGPGGGIGPEPVEGRLVVLDLAELDFIGSEGLAAIIIGFLASRRQRGMLALAAPRPAVLEVLRRTRLTDLLRVYASADEALPGLAARPCARH